MISSLLPGFSGSPAARSARAKAADRRPVEPDGTTIVGDAPGEGSLPRGDPWYRLEQSPAVEELRDAGDAPETAGGSDPRIRRPYAPEEITEMESMWNARYPSVDPEHHHRVHPWDHLAPTAPVMGNPSLTPASGHLVADSCMTGHGGEVNVCFHAL